MVKKGDIILLKNKGIKDIFMEERTVLRIWASLKTYHTYTSIVATFLDAQLVVEH